MRFIDNITPKIVCAFQRRRDENIETEHSIWEDRTIHRRPVENYMCFLMVQCVHPTTNFPLDTRVPTRVRSYPREGREE